MRLSALAYFSAASTCLILSCSLRALALYLVAAASCFVRNCLMVPEELEWVLHTSSQGWHQTIIFIGFVFLLRLTLAGDLVSFGAGSPSPCL